MGRQLACMVLLTTCLACGSQTRGPEPVEGPGTQTDDPGPVEGPVAEVDDPGTPSDDPELVEGSQAEPKDVEGSASGTEVKPMQVKDFDVSTEVDFNPSPVKEKKDSAIEKIGMGTAGTTDCYVDLLEKQADLEGKLEITFKINPAGVPASVKVSTNTTGSAALEKCAVKSFKSKKFPKKLAGPKPVQAVVTITLRPYK